MEYDKKKPKNIITISEAFILSVVSYGVLSMWKDVLDQAAIYLFGKHRYLAALFFTAILFAIMLIFENVDIGKTSLYELK